MNNYVILGEKYRQIDEAGRVKLVDTSIDVTKKIKDFLGPENFALFQQAEELNSQLWSSYADQGLFITETIYENIFIPELNENIDITVGLYTNLAPGVHPSQLIMHPSYTEWITRLPNEIFSSFITIIE